MSISPLVATYTLPLVTTGTANLLAGPAESRVWLVSLLYRTLVRSSGSNAYNTAGPHELNWSALIAQAMPFWSPLEETENVGPGNAEVNVVLLSGVVLITPLFKWNIMPTFGVPLSSPPGH